MSEYMDQCDKEEDITEAICAICDNGGDVICCEGKCLRAFHATVEAGSDTACDSLGFSKKQVKEIETFKCENCKYNQHQCYVCGKLGSSDKSVGVEVFQCDSRTCGYFYHPSCVANALPSKYKDGSKDTEAKIASGKPFICPLHFCYSCKESEPDYETDSLMQFAVCRRCPKAYHKKCLPGTISFEADDDKGIQQRAWEELIPNKILMYCMEHIIDDELLTPDRFHINFPNSGMNIHINFPNSGMKKEIQPMELVPEVNTVPRKRRAVKHKSSSARDMRFSGTYSLRDRKLLRKNNLLKKNMIGSVKTHKFSSRKNVNVPVSSEDSDATKLMRSKNCKVVDSSKNVNPSSKNVNPPLSSEDSDATKLRNTESSGSVMRSKNCKVVDSSKNVNPQLSSEDSDATKLRNTESSDSVIRSKNGKVVETDKDYVATTKLENRKRSGSEMRTKISNTVLDNENSKEIKLENWESCGSHKRSRNGKGAAENRKRSGSEKQIKGSNEVLDNENSKEINLENKENCSLLEKHSKGAAESNAAIKVSNEVLDNENSKEINLENQENCGSEKRSRSSKGAAESNATIKVSNEVLDNENSKEINLENQENCGSDKQSRSSKGAAESNAATNKEYISNVHEEPAYKNTNSPGTHDSGSRSKTGFISLGFAPAMCRPFLENSSAGWLNE